MLSTFSMFLIFHISKVREQLKIAKLRGKIKVKEKGEVAKAHKRGQ